MKTVKLIEFLVVATGILMSCAKESPLAEQNIQSNDLVPMTKACVAAPKIVVMVETNDVNPLNAMDYVCPDDSSFFDIVELFAANIHKEDYNGETRPTLYLNDKLAPVLEQPTMDYVDELHRNNMKVVLTVLGDWQGIGLANMNETQADQFAHILAFTVQQYNLDGIGFDDEYANYQGPLVDGSFGNIIKKLHALLPADKLITVFAYGNINQIDAEAGAMIDYAYTNFTYWNASPDIAGVTNAHWAPSSYNLGNSYITAFVKNKATAAKNNGYGAIMTFNLRQKSEVNPLPVLQAISDGLGCGTISCNNGDRSREAGVRPEGHVITYSLATGN